MAIISKVLTDWDLHGAQAASMERAFSAYLSHADNADLSIGGTSFTFSLWVKLRTLPDTAEYYGFAGKDTGGSPRNAWTIFTSEPNSFASVFQIYVADADNTLISSFGALEVNKWYHVTVWYDSSIPEIGLRVNQTEDIEPATLTPVDETAEFNIGNLQSDTWALLDGEVDSAGFWKRVLTPAEREEIWNEGYGQRYANLSAALKVDLISWWDFEDDFTDAHGANDLTNNNGVEFTFGILAPLDEDDISTEILAIPDASHGKDGETVASQSIAGQLQLILDNSQGKYNRSNSDSPLFGLLDVDRPIWLEALVNGVRYPRWFGFIKNIEADPRSRTASLTAEGSLAYLTTGRVLVSQNPGEFTGTLIDSILDAYNWSYPRRIAVGQIETGRWFESNPYALDAIRRLAETEIGYFGESKDGALVYEDRLHRYLGAPLISKVTFSDDPDEPFQYLLGLKEGNPVKGIFNEAVAEARNFEIGPTNVELWRLQNYAPILAPGESIEFEAYFPNEGGTTDGEAVLSWVPPDDTDVIPTGVAFADLGISALTYGDRMRFTVVNNHATNSATLSTVRARGRPIIALESSLVRGVDALSQASYGPHHFKNLGVWYASVPDAQVAVETVVGRYGFPQPIIQLPIWLYNDTIAAAVFDLEVSDRITLVANGLRTKLGLNRELMVENIRESVDYSRGAPMYVVTLGLAAALSEEGGFWIVDTSELGTGTRLAFT